MTKYIHDCLSVVEQEEEATMKQLTIDCVNVEAHLVNVEAHLNTCVASDLGVRGKGSWNVQNYFHHETRICIMGPMPKLHSALFTWDTVWYASCTGTLSKVRKIGVPLSPSTTVPLFTAPMVDWEVIACVVDSLELIKVSCDSNWFSLSFSRGSTSLPLSAPSYIIHSHHEIEWKKMRDH